MSENAAGRDKEWNSTGYGQRSTYPCMPSRPGKEYSIVRALSVARGAITTSAADPESVEGMVKWTLLCETDYWEVQREMEMPHDHYLFEKVVENKSIFISLWWDDCIYLYVLKIRFRNYIYIFGTLDLLTTCNYFPIYL